jgi:hypothetical protein
LISDDEDSVVLKITVKPVHHLQILPWNPLHYQIPIGTTMEFKIFLRDDEGQPFSIYDTNSFQLQTNKADIIHADLGNNGSVFIKALLPGDVILRVSTQVENSLSS